MPACSLAREPQCFSSTSRLANAAGRGGTGWCCATATGRRRWQLAGGNVVWLTFVLENYREVCKIWALCWHSWRHSSYNSLMSLKKKRRMNSTYVSRHFREAGNRSVVCSGTTVRSGWPRNNHVPPAKGRLVSVVNLRALKRSLKQVSWIGKESVKLGSS